MRSILARIKITVLDFIELTIIMTVVVGLVFLFICQPIRVIGDSMLPNFKDHEQLIAEKISIKQNKIKRGDVVIIKHPENQGIYLIKRIIGLPNETLKIQEGNIYINGQKIDEHYLPNNIQTNGYGKIKDGEVINIPSTGYIILGDNRNDSSDSRAWGILNEEFLVGKGFLVYYPIKELRFINLQE